MSHAPKIVVRKALAQKELRIPAGKSRIFVPSIEEMAAYCDALKTEHLRRWIVLALNTWARPEAISDFDPNTQWDRRLGMIDLNPLGRAQTNKHRPIINYTQGLAGWLAY